MYDSVACTCWTQAPHHSRILIHQMFHANGPVFPTYFRTETCKIRESLTPESVNVLYELCFLKPLLGTVEGNTLIPKKHNFFTKLFPFLYTIKNLWS